MGVKESTSKLARFHGRRIMDFLHSYVYLRWTSIYVKPVKFVLENPGLFPGWLYRGLGEMQMHAHHAKVITNDDAHRIIDINKPISVKNSELVLPYKKARDIILANSKNIAVTNCACRQNSGNPCQPVDVCFYLGEPFVDFILEHQPAGARRVGVVEALEILEREHEKGHVHTAWFKDVLGDRLYAICNCCSCCCLGIRALAYGFETVASSGYTAAVNGDDCTLCGTCAGICQFKAINVYECAQIDVEKCKGCGICVDHCPHEAIFLQLDNGKPGPLILPGK